MYILFCLLLFFAPLSECIEVETNYGPVEGTSNSIHNMFLGIPYAKPPLNNLRFAAPEPLESWTIPIPAFELQPACIQPHFPVFIERAPEVSEDCLFLNIYTSLTSTNTSNYPVMIWFYGGGFVHEEGGQIYDPEALMSYIDDVIIVTFNHRLGILGFFYDNTFDTGIEGNFGFMDQEFVIKWVYENIQNFGGDKDRITLFGVASGALSVGLHLLFNDQYIYGGIMQSVPFGVAMREPDTWYNAPTIFNELTGCNETTTAVDTLNCWRNLSPGEILKAQNNSLMWIPNWSDILKYTPTIADLTQNGILTNQMIPEFVSRTDIKPFIMGFNTNEGWFTLHGASHLMSYQQLKTMLTFRFGAVNVDAILAFYNVEDTTEDLHEAWAQILTDQVWKCPQRKIAMNMASDVFMYEFDVIDAEVYGQLLDDKPYCSEHVCHGSEIVTFWRPFEYNYTYSQQSEDVAYAMYDYWTTFAKTLDPNSDITDWLNYNEGEGKQVWKVTDTEKSVLVNWDVCDFWDIVGYAGEYCTEDCFTTSAPETSTSAPKTTTTVADVITTDDDIEAAYRYKSVFSILFACTFLLLCA
eukprot:352766_1